MPAIIPLVVAGVAAAGSAIASANSKAASDNANKSAADQAQAARDAANANANQAIGSTQAQTTTGIQQQQQNFANALLTPQLVQNQSALTSQLQAASNGQGPNPALDQLNQTTGQNVANQSALMAGQRGAGANAGLIARQAAQQGAATQQQAVGQGATLSAQQQIAARQQLQQALSGQMTSGLQAQQGAASTALGNQGIITGALTGASNQGNQAALQAMQSSQQNNAQNNLQQQQSLGAGFNAVGTGLTAFGSKSGSDNNDGYSNPQIDHWAQGGEITNLKENYSGKGPRSRVGRHLMGGAKGGEVEAILSPGEIYLTPDETKKVVEGKKSPLDGERIPGKAQVSGDSPENDTVRKTVETGGFVIKRSKAQDEESAKKFVQTMMAKRGKK